MANPKTISVTIDLVDLATDDYFFLTPANGDYVVVHMHQDGENEEHEHVWDGEYIPVHGALHGHLVS